MSDFRVGQKVVCINDVFEHPSWELVPNKPRKDIIYTIRAIGIEIFTGDDGSPETHISVHLNELVNPPINWRWSGLSEQMFVSERFRPLIEKKTDTGMAILREILERESFTDRVPERT